MCVLILPKNVEIKKFKAVLEISCSLSLLSLRAPAHSHCIFLGVNLLPLMTGHWSPYSVINVLKRKGIINCFREFPLPLLLCWAENIIADPLKREPLTNHMQAILQHVAHLGSSSGQLRTQRELVFPPQKAARRPPLTRHGASRLPFARPP